MQNHVCITNGRYWELVIYLEHHIWVASCLGVSGDMNTSKQETRV